MKLSDDEVAGLMAARMLITDKRNWTHGAYARNKVRDFVWVNSTSACQWCAVGAYMAVTMVDPCSAIAAPLMGANDDSGHAAVLRVMDRMIDTGEA